MREGEQSIKTLWTYLTVQTNQKEANLELDTRKHAIDTCEVLQKSWDQVIMYS